VEFQLTEQLKSIVAQLTQARQSKGITLEEIATKTFIPQRLLKALEEEKFDRLPEAVFVQGFVRRYADEVGLDGMALSRSFVIQPPELKKAAEEFLSVHPDDAAFKPAATVSASAPPKAAPPKATQPAPAPAVQPLIEPVAPLTPPVATLNAIEDPLPDYSPASQGSSAHWFYWIGGGLLAGLAGLFLVNQLTHLPATPPTQQAAVPTKAAATPAASVKPSPAASSTPSPQPSASASPTPSPTPSPAASASASPTTSGPIGVTLTLTEDSWVEIEADGKSLEASTLPKGTQKSWSATKSLSVFTGNAHGVSVSYNQGASKPMGTTADPAELRFPDKPN
jgi:cytoskeleton protein RodZ